MIAVIAPLLVFTSMTAVLLRQQQGRQPLRMPWATLAIFAVTLGVGAFAVFDDTLLDAIRRDGDRLAAGEWWRLITPLVGQDGGLPGLIFNLVLLLVLGAVVENLLGWRVLLVAYLAAGLVSEVAAYTIMPGQGFAGNSVANFGLIGLIIGSGVMSGHGERFIGLIGLVAGVVLLILWDLHAVGFWVGVLVGVVGWLVARRPIGRMFPLREPKAGNREPS